MNRTIPGTIEVAGREFLYIETAKGERFDQIIDQAITCCNDVPMPQFGGVIEEKVRVILENGTVLLAISYKGDLAGWRQKLAAYFDAKRRKWGVASKGRLCLSDGTALDLDKCDVAFDD